MNDILNNIIEQKKLDLTIKKRNTSIEKLKKKVSQNPVLRDFGFSVSKKDHVNIIGEIKKASPSAGLISHNFNPALLAKQYTEAGVSAISVLTEEKYFKGNLSDLMVVRKHSFLPVLRKDFIIDQYQLFESLVSGADAVLLIAALLEKQELTEMINTADSLGLDCLVEVHSEEDLKKVLATPARIIGINNRNLRDFKVDMETAVRLYPKIPADKIVIIESGIKTSGDAKRYYDMGVNSFLVGESLMRSSNVKMFIKELMWQSK